MHRKFILLIFGMAVLMPGLGLAVQAADGAPPRRTAATTTGQAGRNQEPDAKPPDKPNLHPSPARPVPDSEITAAIKRGVGFLLNDQNADGSWGSPGAPKS